VNFAFAGTPGFAAWVLSDLVDLGRRPSIVISQPDRPRGRGRVSAKPAVAGEAERLGFECLQTDDVNEPAVAECLRKAAVSTLVVAAFGQIVRRPLLDSFLCLNIHASLLPAYRGAAPIERALAAGEPNTGVSIMRMTEGVDEGPWAQQRSISIGLRDDAGSVGRTLALIGAIGIDQVLQSLPDGTVTWKEQQGSSTYAAKLTSRDCVLDTRKGAKAVHDQVRSLSPSAGARAASGGLELKVWRTWPYGQAGLDAPPPEGDAAAGRPGRLVTAGERLFLGCGEGLVELLQVQPAGKNKMDVPAFLRGYGERLTDRLAPTEGRNGSACDDR
jgi:methionyl-tRNA formyltransferase